MVKLERFEEGIDLLEQCIQEEPDDAVYPHMLAFCYSVTAHQQWRYVEDDDMYFATRRSEVAAAEQYLGKMKALSRPEVDIDELIADLEHGIARQTTKRFHGNPLAVGGALILGALFLFTGIINVGLYLLVFGGLYWLSCMTLQYELNRRALEGESMDTSMDGVREAMSEEESFGGRIGTLLLSLLWILPLLPIMALWNLIKNRESISAMFAGKTSGQ